MAQEVDGLEVFAAAIYVWNPFTSRRAVVAIEHRGRGIDAQTVDMEILKPMKRARDQEALHFAPPEIVDVGVPVAVETLARIEMLVERGAVEAGQPMRVSRKMRRYPVEDEADTRAVQAIDEAHEAFPGAVPTGWREHAERLIAPGAAERMLRDRQGPEMG